MLPRFIGRTPHWKKNGKGWSTIRAFFKGREGRFWLEPWTQSESFCSFFKASSYGGIFHCSTCAIDRLRSRPRSNGSHFGYVREKRSLPHSQHASQPSIFEFNERSFQRTPQTKNDWGAEKKPSSFSYASKRLLDQPTSSSYGAVPKKIWNKGTRVPNWNHGKSLLRKYTKSSHSSVLGF